MTRLTLPPLVLGGIVATVSACDVSAIKGLGQQCIEGGGQSIREDPGVRGFRCEAGLYCNSMSGLCERPVAEGGPCKGFTEPWLERLDPGLVCNDGIASRPRAVGGACSAPEHCATGLLCVPAKTPTARGACTTPSVNGGPCVWWPKFVGGGDVCGSSNRVQPERLEHIGCATEFTCIPSARPTLDVKGFAGPTRCHDRNGICGYPGTCAPILAGAPFSPCVTGEGCRDGRCDLVPRPYATAETPGFGCGIYKTLYDGPWAGACHGDKAVQGDPCRADTECADGLVCATLAATNTSEAKHQREEGDSCGGLGTMASGRTGLCAIGLVCTRERQDSVRCRKPGTAVEGSACAITGPWCASGLTCIESKCQNGGHLGATCTDQLLCEAELACVGGKCMDPLR